MFFDLEVLSERTTEVLLLLLAFLFGKGANRRSCRHADEISSPGGLVAGVGLAQFGEFGFVVLQLALREKVVSEEVIAPLLNAGILSMFLTPLIVYKAPTSRQGKNSGSLAKLLRTKAAEDLEQKTVGHNDHVISSVTEFLDNF